MKCPTCESCEYEQYCGATEIMRKCDRHKKLDMTEQEWLQTATTEQLAEWLRGVYWHCHEIDCEHCNYPWRCMEKGDIIEWLKQPHTTIKE